MKELLQQLRDALVEHTGNYKLYGEALEQHSAAIAAATAELEKSEQARPDILEKLTYHFFERRDMTLEDCLNYLRTSGWHNVHERTARQMVFQLTELLANNPPYLAPPSESEAVALLREMQAHCTYRFIQIGFRRKIDAILKGQP